MMILNGGKDASESITKAVLTKNRRGVGLTTPQIFTIWIKQKKK